MSERVAVQMGSTFQNVCQDSINEEVSGLSNALSGAVSIIDNTWFQYRRENEGGDLAFSTASQANLLAMVCHMYPSAPGDR